jgi:hypothetical protein
LNANSSASVPARAARETGRCCAHLRGRSNHYRPASRSHDRDIACETNGFRPHMRRLDVQPTPQMGRRTCRRDSKTRERSVLACYPVRPWLTTVTTDDSFLYGGDGHIPSLPSLLSESSVLSVMPINRGFPC